MRGGEQRKQGSPPKLGKGCWPSIGESSHTGVRQSVQGRAYQQFTYLDKEI